MVAERSSQTTARMCNTLPRDAYVNIDTAMFISALAPILMVMQK